MGGEHGGASLPVQGAGGVRRGAGVAGASLCSPPPARGPSGCGGSYRGQEGGWARERKKKGKDGGPLLLPSGRERRLAFAPFGHKMALLSFTRSWVLGA